MSHIYAELVNALDRISFGFPRSWLGIEKYGLKKIFSKEDASHFVEMSSGYQTPQAYAGRTNRTLEEAENILEDMAKRGLIYRRRNQDMVEYRQMPFAFGLIEFQVYNPDSSWQMPMGAYISLSKFGKNMGATMPFYRTVPIHASFVGGTGVLSYDDLDTVLNRHQLFAVASCLCRKLQQMNPRNQCHHPLETCVMTDDMAAYYLENGWGRQASRDEIREILMEGDKDGRVIQITNSQNAENICSCCTCGCGMLGIKSRFPGPSSALWSNYYAVYDKSKCISCGKCVERCQFQAVKKVNGKIEINLENCIGCGLCVSTCEPKALSLAKKAEDKVYIPPETYDDALEIWQTQKIEREKKS